jgi:hypothetical protein
VVLAFLAAILFMTAVAFVPAIDEYYDAAFVAELDSHTVGCDQCSDLVIDLLRRKMEAEEDRVVETTR